MLIDKSQNSRSVRIGGCFTYARRQRIESHRVQWEVLHFFCYLNSCKGVSCFLHLRKQEWKTLGIYDCLKLMLKDIPVIAKQAALQIDRYERVMHAVQCTKGRYRNIYVQGSSPLTHKEGGGSPSHFWEFGRYCSLLFSHSERNVYRSNSISWCHINY